MRVKVSLLLLCVFLKPYLYGQQNTLSHGKNFSVIKFCMNPGKANTSAIAPYTDDNPNRYFDAVVTRLSYERGLGQGPFSLLYEISGRYYFRSLNRGYNVSLNSAIRYYLRNKNDGINNEGYLSYFELRGSDFAGIVDVSIQTRDFDNFTLYRDEVRKYLILPHSFTLIIGHQFKLTNYIYIDCAIGAFHSTYKSNRSDRYLKGIDLRINLGLLNESHPQGDH